MANNYSFRATLLNVVPNLRLWLVAAGMLMCVLPTLRSDAAQPKKADKKPAEESPEEQTTTITGTWTLPDGRTMTTSRTSGFMGGSKAHHEEMNKLIAEKKYNLLSTSDSPDGEMQYEYSFTLSDGNNIKITFSMPLENVTSWEDYQQKQEEQRHEKINQAIAAGQFRLLNWEMIRVHLCRDVETNQKFKVQRIPRRDGTVIAFPRADFGKIPPGVQQTSWQEHLQAIRQKKRDLLEMETINYFTYEITVDDGTKVIWSYAGGEPLKMPAQQ